MQTVFSVPARADDPRGKRIWMEDEVKCVKFRRLLEADENRVVDLVQFYANPGGLRTYELRQITGTSRSPIAKRTAA